MKTAFRLFGTLVVTLAACIVVFYGWQMYWSVHDPHENYARIFHLFQASELLAVVLVGPSAYWLTKAMTK